MGIGAVKGMYKAIFLDRDGVLNQAIIKNGKPYPPRTLSEVTIDSDVLPALLALKNVGFILIGITNQPDIARGVTDYETVTSINNALCQQLPLHEIKVCYHDDADHCECRKPKSGLLLQSAKQYNLDLSSCFMIGDRWKDIAAGQKVNCKTIWLNRHYLEPEPENPDYITSTLADAANWILSNTSRSLADEKSSSYEH